MTHPRPGSSLSRHLLLLDALLTATCPSSPGTSSAVTGHLPRPLSPTVATFLLSLPHFPGSPFPPRTSSSPGLPLPLAIAATAVVDVALLSNHRPRPIAVLLCSNHALTDAIPSSSLPIFRRCLHQEQSTSSLSLTSPVSPFPPHASSSPSHPLPLVAITVAVTDVALLSDHRPQPIAVLLRPDRALTTTVPSSSRFCCRWVFSSPPPATAQATMLSPAGALPSFLPLSLPSGAVDLLSLPHFLGFCLSSACLFLSQPASSSGHSHHCCGQRCPPLRPPPSTHRRPPPLGSALTTAVPSSS